MNDREIINTIRELENDTSPQGHSTWVRYLREVLPSITNDKLARYVMMNLLGYYIKYHDPENLDHDLVAMIECEAINWDGCPDTDYLED